MISQAILRKAENKLFAEILRGYKPKYNSGHRDGGVFFVKSTGIWKVLVGFYGTHFYGGQFSTEEEAKKAVTVFRAFLQEAEKRGLQLKQA
jgi:hypothetical protein